MILYNHGMKNIDNYKSIPSLKAVSPTEEATAEVYREHKESPGVQLYNERKKKYADAISKWDNYIERAVDENGHPLTKEVLDQAKSTRELLIREMVKSSADYPGDWTVLLYNRVIDPITEEKFVLTRTKAMENMREGTVGKRDKPELFKQHYQAQIDNYHQTINKVFNSTRIGNERPHVLGSSKGVGDPGIVYNKKARQKDGVRLTDRQKNIIEAHEKGHGLRDFESELDQSEIGSVIDPNALETLRTLKRDNGATFRSAYITEPAEIIERMSQFKNYFGMKANEKFTRYHLEYIRRRYAVDTGLDNDISDLLYLITPNTEDAFIEVINKYPI